MYKKKYHDVLPSILARSVDRWTGFGEMPSSATGETLDKDSSEGHRGKSLSCGSNYLHDKKKCLLLTLLTLVLLYLGVRNAYSKKKSKKSGQIGLKLGVPQK
jgi:hypothetical protein